MSATHDRRPKFTTHDARRLAGDVYGLLASAAELPSERDQNFRLLTEDGRRFVLKLARADERPLELDLQQRAMQCAARVRPGAIQEVVPTRDGEERVAVPDASGRSHWLRLLTWLPGRPLAEVRPHSPELLNDLGRLLGGIDRELRGFQHPAATRELPWDLTRAHEVIAEHAPSVQDPERRALLRRLTERAPPADELDHLRTGVVHNDANDHNVLVHDGLDGQHVTGLIDFGDLLSSWVLGEVAVAAAYATLGKRDPLRAAAHLVGGYHSAYPIPEEELPHLFDLIALRLCTSVALSAHQGLAEPDQSYLRVSEAPAWELLERLVEIPRGLAHAVFREACGLEPCSSSVAVAGWLRTHGDTLAPVLDVDLERRVEIDLSVASSEIAALGPVERWTRHLAALRAEGAPVAVGHYGEPRTCYEGERFAHATEDRDELRTIHLGVDLFVDAGEAVRAPLDGVVHSAQDNAGPLDYGPTVVLRHDPEPGVGFWTLYGHLARESLGALEPGQRVVAGEAFARIGGPRENGGWPPHLHVQVIADLLERGGDFPGVAPPSERTVWLSLCPDAGPLVGLPAREPAAPDPEALRAGRRQHLGPSLSLSYRRPLTIVRGHGTFLYDHLGRAYLDAVNNVPHVGHGHPRVVRAGQEQMAVLNTNTRYLHPLLTTYLERLTALLPAPLEVAFLVCSGSEANELALRLARASTGSRDVVVLESGYHGNTTSLVELSHYKFAGPGGFAPPAHVHPVPLPDPYRGRYRTGDGDPVARYAGHVREACARIATGGGRPTFLVEALPGCGGQIVPPPGYLDAAFRAVREAGGICIADEVQTGFGRVGSHFWAFETQGVTPDIVTLGKPIGNGHPLGAVVTTRAIAERFDGGMEYFNTFGGNPVSCAIGSAVLDVIEDEGLQESALSTGDLLMSELRALGERHPIVGDVRGLGLFVGVELVLDRHERTPATAHAGHVVERMRDRGVLISTDGPDHNVLKIKPPLVFGATEAVRLAETLDAVLRETCLAEGRAAVGPR